MEYSRKRSCSGDDFTPDEMVVADILAHFTYYSSRFFPQWGSKRKRSTNSTLHANNAHHSNITAKYRTSPTTPLNLSWSEPEDFEADPPSFPRRLPPASRLNSKNKRVKKAPRRREPKKKFYLLLFDNSHPDIQTDSPNVPENLKLFCVQTHKELKDMVNALSLENNRLKKVSVFIPSFLCIVYLPFFSGCATALNERYASEETRLMFLNQEEETLKKTYQDLTDWNEHLKSQLALQLDRREEEKQPSTTQMTSSDADSAQVAETSRLFDLLRGFDEHKCSDNFAGSGPFVLTYEFQSVESSKYLSSPMSPSRSEKGNSSIPADVRSCSLGAPDLNGLNEALSDIVPNSCDDQMLLPMNKAAVAAEARKKRIELTRIKYARFR
eukprot:Gb_34214 [translate_table: standard]